MAEAILVANLGYEPGMRCCARALPPRADPAAAGCPDLAFDTPDGRLAWQLCRVSLDQPPFCRYRQLWLGRPGASELAWETDGLRFAFDGWSHEPVTRDARHFLATLVEPRVGLPRWRLRCLGREADGWRQVAERDFGFRFRVGEIAPSQEAVLLLGGPDLVVLSLPGLEALQTYPAPARYHAAAAHYTEDGHWILAAFGMERKRSELTLIDTWSGAAVELGAIHPGSWSVASDLLTDAEVAIPLPIYHGRVLLRMRGVG